MQEFGARLVLRDDMSRTLRQATRAQQDFTRQVENTRRGLQGIARQKVQPVIDAKDKATRKVNAIKQKLAQVKRTVTSPIIKVKDMASRKIESIKNKLKNTKIYRLSVKLRDLASRGIAKVKNTLGGLCRGIHTVAVKARDLASPVLGKIGNIVKGLAVGATVAVGVAGAGAVKSLQEGAKLQQSTGGIETLFKDDAGIVMENAQKAFKTVGVSANEYMENVTSFSASLLASTGGDTKKSAEVADRAMQDMADNANKMGTPLENIQNAYQGFAKQNYTMLDNLKLGYGGTKTEMERLLKDAQKISGQKYDMNNLADVYSAISVIQDNLGITGTTAKEAESTFTGAFGMMKASAQDFLGQLSVGDSEGIKRTMGNMIDSVGNFLFNNLVPMVSTIISNLPTAIGTASKKLAPKIKENVLPLVKNIKDGILDGLKSIGIDISPIERIFSKLSSGLGGGTGIGGIFTAMKDGAVSAINIMLPIIESLINVISNIAPTVMSIFDTIRNMIASIDLSGIITTLGAVVEAVLPTIQTVIEIVCGVITAIMPTVSDIFSKVGNIIAKVAGVIGKHVKKLQPLFEAVCGLICTLWSAIAPVVEPVADVIISVVDGMLSAIEPAIEILTDMINLISDAVSAVGDFVGGAVDKVGSFFGFAYGKDRVPYNNYPAVLHEGERVLTRNEADQLDRAGGTRGVATSSLPQKGYVGVSTSQVNNVTVAKLADSIVVREDADIERIANSLVQRLQDTAYNMA